MLFSGGILILFLLLLVLRGLVVMGVIVLLLLGRRRGRGLFPPAVTQGQRCHLDNVLILHLKPLREGSKGPGRLFDNQVGPVPGDPGLGAEFADQGPLATG